mgnify:CR=1 FL=1
MQRVLRHLYLLAVHLPLRSDHINNPSPHSRQVTVEVVGLVIALSSQRLFSQRSILHVAEKPVMIDTPSEVRVLHNLTCTQVYKSFSTLDFST